MKGRSWAAVFLALLAAKGAGILPKGREMEEQKLVTALALDGTKATAVTGVRVTEEEEPEVLTGEGASLAEACGDLRGSSVRRAYLGQTEQLLLGSEQEVDQALEFVLRHQELRTDTLIYMVKGDAGQALAQSAGKTTAETGGEDPRGRTVGKVMPRLAQGDYVLIPALAAGEEDTLVPAGWAAVGPEGVAGYLEGAAALGAELLSGMGADRVITLPGGAVELAGVRSWAGGGKLRCTLTGRVVQGKPSEAQWAAWGEECIQAALEPGWDCWGLDRENGALHPWRWAGEEGLDIRTLKVEVTGKLVGDDESGT